MLGANIEAAATVRDDVKPAVNGTLAFCRRYAAMLLWGVVGAGAAVRLLLIVTAPQPFGYAYDYYYKALEILWWQRRVPIPDDCLECYQPILFYVAELPFFGLGRAIHRVWPATVRPELRTALLLTAICGAVCVFYGYRLLKLLRFEREYVLLGTAMLIVLPVICFSGAGIESDVLLGAFGAALLYECSRYSVTPDGETAGRAAAIGGLAGLAAATKYSGLAAVLFAAGTLGLPLVRSWRSGGAWQRAVIGGTVCLLIGSGPYVSNWMTYGEPLFANEAVFRVGDRSRAQQIDFVTFDLPGVIRLARTDGPQEKLTEQPLYASFWSMMYGLTWHDLGVFSLPGRHGDFHHPYPLKPIPNVMNDAVLVFGMVPTVLACVGLLSAVRRRSFWPSLVFTGISLAVYVTWVLHQREWALKPKYLLYLTPFYAVCAMEGLVTAGRRLPRSVHHLTIWLFISSICTAAAYVFWFALV